MNSKLEISLESRHLSAETLAVLAERGARESGDERSLQHLARCRSCLAAYADAVRYRAAWLAVPEMFAASGTPAMPATRPWNARRAASWSAAAALLLAVGIGAPLLARRHASAPPATGPIATLLERASATDFVYLGGEPGAAERPLSYREGGVENRAESDAIEALRQRYEADDARHLADLHALAAALTASGRTDLAHDYVQEGRALAPEHTGFLLLAAILAQREGNAPRADELLRQARAIAPHDLTLMLDHAILLARSGAHADATALLREVIRRAPGSALAARAGRQLGELPARR